MCTLTFSVSATAFAQHEQVTLNFKQVTVRQVLNEIQRQTRLSFIYNTEQTEQLGQISIEAHNESVTSLLDRIFAGTGLTWKIQEDMILISQAGPETTAIPQAQEQETVLLTGTVTDIQKMPLPGVTVKISGTSFGTSTDANGKVTYDTYTGIKNAPTIIGKYTDNSVTPAKTYNHAVEAAYVMSGNLVTFMFIDATGAYTTNGKKDITFLAGQSVSKATYDVDGNVWYSYNAVVDGEITTVKVKGGTNVTNGSDGGYTKTNVVGTNFKYNNKNLVTGVTLPSNSGTLNSYTVYTGDDGVYKLSGAYTIGLGASKTRYTVASDAKMFVIDTDGVITKVADVKDITTDTSAEYIALFDNADGDIDYLFVQQVDNGKTENGSGNVTPGTVTKLDYNATDGEVKVTADKAGKYTVTVEVLSNGTYVKAASYTAIVTAPNTESAAIQVGKLTAGNARIVCGDVVVLA